MKATPSIINQNAYNHTASLYNTKYKKVWQNLKILQQNKISKLAFPSLLMILLGYKKFFYYHHSLSKDKPV